MRKRFVASAGALLAMSMWTTAAWAEPTGVRPPYGPPPQAAGPNVAGCPPNAGWFLATPSGGGHLSAAYDHNGDFQVCVRFLPAGGVTFMDNVVR